MRVHTYVITTDCGSAPNYDAPAPTLTICKPRIRRHAVRGELVIAFNGRTLSPEPHSVCWAGIIDEVIPLADYWSDPRFVAKQPHLSETPDNIYREENGILVQIPNNVHDAGNVKTDVSGRNSLIFSEFWRVEGRYEILPERFGMRMSGNRRTEPVHEIDYASWRKLRSWLDTVGIRPMEMTRFALGRPSQTRARRRTCRRC